MRKHKITRTMLIKRKSTRMPAANDWDSGEGKWTSEKGWKHL